MLPLIARPCWLASREPPTPPRSAPFCPWHAGSLQCLAPRWSSTSEFVSERIGVCISCDWADHFAKSYNNNAIAPEVTVHLLTVMHTRQLGLVRCATVGRANIWSSCVLCQSGRQHLLAT